MKAIVEGAPRFQTSFPLALCPQSIKSPSPYVTNAECRRPHLQPADKNGTTIFYYYRVKLNPDHPPWALEIGVYEHHPA